jgi:hypothetical protein
MVCVGTVLTVRKRVDLKWGVYHRTERITAGLSCYECWDDLSAAHYKKK